MFNINQFKFLLLSITLLLVFSANALEDKTLPVTTQLVDTFSKLSGGPHPGYRANHAKGIVIDGEFIPDKAAASITKAAHLQNTKSPVVVRFSNATGVPNIPDTDGNAFPKGIAIRFLLPKDASTDIVSISVNSFPAAKPEDFLGLLNAIAASGPDAKKPTPIEQFLNSHPAAMRFVKIPKLPPVSFATQPFYGVNAFKFTNSKGKVHYGRYIIQPLSGAHFLSKEEATKATPNYLMDELPVRLKKDSVKYQISVQLADKNDVINDPTVVWPSSRKVVKLGILVLKTPHQNGEAYAKATMFNPLSLVDGIEASDDPILLARPAAYAVSFGRRSK